MPINSTQNMQTYSKMFYVFVIPILIAILFFAYVFFIHPHPSDVMACSSKNFKITAFGDSLVAGYGATKGNDFPSLLSLNLGVPVLNAAIPPNRR
jgi:lysophospholipase L1-like esterase